jgi:hypothetical protein
LVKSEINALLLLGYEISTKLTICPGIIDVIAILQECPGARCISIGAL